MRHSEIVVQKYGGTRVATPELVRDVAENIQQTHEAGFGTVVVASAMGKTTDQLLDLSRTVCSSEVPRERDQLLATGEEQTVALLAMALHELGVDAVSLSGPQAGMSVTGSYGSAMISDVRPGRIRDLLADGQVAIVAGFQGINSVGDVTTLGRGGSDTTAVALAAALRAGRCEIYTDVDGVYTADPRIVSDACPISALSAAEMAELAWRGAKVIHPRAVELAALYEVELHIRFSRDLGTGTVIMGGESLEQLETRETVAGIVHDPDTSRIVLGNIRKSPATLDEIFAPLAEAGISVDVIAESPTKEGLADVAFTVRRSDFADAEKIAREVAAVLGGYFKSEAGLAKVSVVGTGMLNRPGYAARMFSCLGRAGIPITTVSTSEIQLTCVVAEDRAEEAVRLLHREFELERNALYEPRSA